MNQFSVPAFPDAKKEKGRGKLREFSMFSASDFTKFIDNGDLDDWGVLKNS